MRASIEYYLRSTISKNPIQHVDAELPSRAHHSGNRHGPLHQSQYDWTYAVCLLLRLDALVAPEVGSVSLVVAKTTLVERNSSHKDRSIFGFGATGPLVQMSELHER